MFREMTDPRLATMKHIFWRCRLLDRLYLRAQALSDQANRLSTDRAIRRLAEKTWKRYYRLVDLWRENSPGEWAKFQGEGI